ncbi:MAG: FtsK/SpoIIIE domain-containing protein [Candidatus Eremiobacterota bacterium]
MAELGTDALWKGSSVSALKVPLGPSGARKLQHLEMGVGTAHHALVVGRPGSGKSNLMHILICTLALVYPPTEVQLYLIDFKKGVEFKPYADLPLPHARVIAIESEREFGYSVLQGLDQELQRRGDRFREARASNLAEFRQARGEVVPRILLIVDEFQEFFARDDRISQEASLLLDRLVRQGRAFGIHVMLGSQTLAGTNPLPRSTVDQMAIRVALACSEADSRLILADDNPSARLLSRPGEAIYNASNGLVEGNNLFQVALFSEDDRKRQLARIGALGRGPEATVVFEGNEPARLAECEPLLGALAVPGQARASAEAEAWLGQPVALLPPVGVRFRRQSGSHLVVVNRDEAQGLGALVSLLVSLLAQLPARLARFWLLDFVAADSPCADLSDQVKDRFEDRVSVVRRRDLARCLEELACLTARRVDGEDASVGHFVLLMGLQRARDLRPSDGGFGGFDLEGSSPSPFERLATVLRDGPEVGVHVVAWCDTFPNLSRVVDRRLLGEFCLRAVGPCSTEDSMNLVDDQAASRLQPNRMLLYDEDRPGALVKFRPFCVPDQAWLRDSLQRIR